VAHAQARRLQLVGHGLRALGRVARQRDELHATLLEVGLQPAQFEQVLQADGAVQPAVEDQQREVRRPISAELENAVFERGYLQRRHRLAWHQGVRRSRGRHGGLRADETGAL
jgi:hypothetical protein